MRPSSSGGLARVMVGSGAQRSTRHTGGWLAWLLVLVLALAPMLAGQSVAGMAETADLCSQGHGDPASPDDAAVEHDCCWGLCAPTSLAPPPESPSVRAPAAAAQPAHRPRPAAVAAQSRPTAHQPRAPPVASTRSPVA